MNSNLKRLVDFSIGVPLIYFLRLSASTKTQAETSSARPKILIIKLAAVGDTILLVPVLRALRRKMPEAQIDFLVSSVNISLAKTIPYVNQVMKLPGFSPLRLIPFIFQLRKEKYDVVIDLEQWARGSALLSYFTGANERVGFDTPQQNRSGLFTRKLKKSNARHEIDEFFDLVSLIFPLQHDSHLELWETDEGRKQAEIILNASKAFTKTKILIHPGCGADGFPREWPLNQYALLINWLMNKFQISVFISGGPDEVEKTSNLNKLVQMRAIDCGGKLSWAGTISLVNKMDFVISGNTGVMHVAAAFKKKQIALHGPTNPVIWGPLNSNAKIIQSSCPKCPSLILGFEYHSYDQSCMEKISLEEVKKAVHELIL